MLQIQDANMPSQAALRASVLGMFADNQAAAQRAPLLQSVGIVAPPAHNILQHLRDRMRHDTFRSLTHGIHMSFQRSLLQQCVPGGSAASFLACV